MSSNTKPQQTDGRDNTGRFTKGNAGGPGNPYAAKSAQLRTALMDAVTDEDIKAVAQTLIQEARAGNVQAGRELLDRTLGKAHQTRTTELTGPGGDPLNSGQQPTERLMGLLRGDGAEGQAAKQITSQARALEAARPAKPQASEDSGEGDRPG